MESVHGEGQDRAGREVGPRTFRYHKWVVVEPGVSVCARCEIVRTFVKRGGKRWKVYYQKPGKAKRPLGKRRRTPVCGASAAVDSGPD